MCVDTEWNIGKDGDLLFKISSDMKNFKEKTKDGVLIMGRKTFDSLGGPLPGRIHLVLTSAKNKTSSQNVIYFNSVFEIKKHVAEIGANPWVIGGSKIIDEFLDYIDIAYITKVGINRSDIADTKMHNFEKDKKWNVVHVTQWRSGWSRSPSVDTFCTFRYEIYTRK